MAIDLFCGLGGWAEGFLSEGYDVVGFDIERRPYPGQLVLHDVCTLIGSQFSRVAVIVASSPCQEFSYRHMPWKRAKALGPPELGMKLFAQAFRIRDEASIAAGRVIPLVAENVIGAQKWVGKAPAHYGSYYLWGDIGSVGRRIIAGEPRFGNGLNPRGGLKVPSGEGRRTDQGNGARFTSRDCGIEAKSAKANGGWFNDYKGEKCVGISRTGSQSAARKEASAQIAKIPFPLAQYIARAFKP